MAISTVATVGSNVRRRRRRRKNEISRYSSSPIFQIPLLFYRLFRLFRLLRPTASSLLLLLLLAILLFSTATNAYSLTEVPYTSSPHQTLSPNAPHPGSGTSPVNYTTFGDFYTLRGWGFGLWIWRNESAFAVVWNATTACAAQYNDGLNNSSEIDKATSGIATTVMALIPALLAFGAWYTADVGTLWWMDREAALATGAMTLGFRVEKLKTLKKARVWAARDLVQGLRGWGKRKRLGHDDDREVGPEVESQKLRRIVEMSYADGDSRLRKLQQEVLTGRPTPPTYVIHLVSTAFFILQLALVFAITVGVFRISSSTFVWLCPEHFFFAYVASMLLAGLVAMLVHGLVASSWVRSDEVFHLEPAPEERRKEGTFYEYSGPSVFDDDEFLRVELYRGSWAAFNIKRSLATLRHLWPRTLCSKRNRKPHSLPALTRRVFSIVRTRLLSPHPQTIVLRPSSTFRHHGPFLQWLIGYIQVLYVGLSSFFFASMVFSSLIFAIAFVAIIVTSIALSRLLSIQLCAWLETRLKLVVIEYNSVTERHAIRTALCAMSGTLVSSVTAGYKYRDGRRVYSPPAMINNNNNNNNNTKQRYVTNNTNRNRNRNSDESSKDELFLSTVKDATSAELDQNINTVGGPGFTLICELSRVVLGLLLGLAMGVVVLFSALGALGNSGDQIYGAKIREATAYVGPATAVFAVVMGGRVVREMRGAAGYRLE